MIKYDKISTINRNNRNLKYIKYISEYIIKTNKNDKNIHCSHKYNTSYARLKIDYLVSKVDIN